MTICEDTKITLKKTSYKILIMDLKIAVVLVAAIVSVSILASTVFAKEDSNPLAKIVQKLDRILDKLTVIANQSGSGTPTGSAAISLKCSWASTVAVQVNYVGHCEPQACPQGFQDVAIDDVKTNWIPNTAWGYTERWCVKL